MTYTDEQLMTIFEKLLQDTRENYIIGYIAFKQELGYIPSPEEYFSDKRHTKKSYATANEKKYLKFYEAREFFVEDPYGIYDTIKADDILEKLNEIAEERLILIEEGEIKTNAKRKYAKG